MRWMNEMWMMEVVVWGGGVVGSCSGNPVSVGSCVRRHFSSPHAGISKRSRPAVG